MKMIVDEFLFGKTELQPYIEDYIHAEGAKIAALLAVREWPAEDGERYIVTGTRRGVVKKTDLRSFRYPHQAGIIAWLCGTPQGGNGYAMGPSVDQVIATAVSDGFPRKSLQMAIRWGTGKSHGLLHPINTVNFEDDESNGPIPPRLDPQAIFDSLFGALDPDSGLDFEARLARKKSILDFVDRGRVAAKRLAYTQAR